MRSAFFGARVLVRSVPAVRPLQYLLTYLRYIDPLPPCALPCPHGQVDHWTGHPDRLRRYPRFKCSLPSQNQPPATSESRGHSLSSHLCRAPRMVKPPVKASRSLRSLAKVSGENAAARELIRKKMDES